MKQIGSYSKISFEYNTGSIPPPFCHRYKIEISNTSPDKYLVDLNLEYYDRDEISVEEIFEEGFSFDDDYSWKGNLPLVWGQEIENKLKIANWKKKSPRRDDDSEFTIRLVQQNQSKVLQPATIRVWEIFVHEIIQAIFELSKKEAPLQIGFLAGSSDNQSQKIDLTYSFANRVILLDSPQKGNSSMDWEEGQKLLKYIFSFDYLPENSFDKIPKKQSNYISPGNGLWYELTPNENANKETITQINRLIKTLKSYR